jgi:hypothetical protein
VLLCIQLVHRNSVFEWSGLQSGNLAELTPAPAYRYATVNACAELCACELHRVKYVQ